MSRRSAVVTAMGLKVSGSCMQQDLAKLFHKLTPRTTFLFRVLLAEI
jgi:hypothetical protein